MVQSLLLVWLVGILWRVWTLARYFQIEGYDSRRYLRWVSARHTRYVNWRALVFVSLALVISLTLGFAGQDTEGVYLAVWGAAGILSVWPEAPKEVKQKLHLTRRAIRLLITAFGLTIVTLITADSTLEAAIGLSDRTRFAVVTISGVVVYHLAPLALPLANLIMLPVEAGFRHLFQAQARRRLRRAGPIVIGITGSYGKTSTKEYLAHLLGGRFRVLATPRSYNTLMGVCRAINEQLSDDTHYDFFIVEMGAYTRGEIREICKLVEPQIGVVTAVGPQHLERFGSLEATQHAKYELIESLPPDGVGVFNWDNHYVRMMYENGYPETRIAVTWENAEHAFQLRFLGRNIKHGVGGIEFDVVDTLLDETQHFSTKLVGEHNIINILLATAVARHSGMTLREIAVRVASLEPAEHRLQRRTLPGGITIIDDAYSANPVGANNVLDVLALYNEGRRVLITPGMVELGPLHEQENRRLGQRAAQVCTDIVLVGDEQTAPIRQGIREAGFDPERLHVMATRDEAIRWFQRELAEGDTVLFLNDLPDTYL